MIQGQVNLSVRPLMFRDRFRKAWMGPEPFEDCEKLRGYWLLMINAKYAKLRKRDMFEYAEELFRQHWGKGWDEMRSELTVVPDQLSEFVNRVNVIGNQVAEWVDSPENAVCMHDPEALDGKSIEEDPRAVLFHSRHAVYDAKEGCWNDKVRASKSDDREDWWDGFDKWLRESYKAEPCPTVPMRDLVTVYRKTKDDYNKWRKEHNVNGKSGDKGGSDASATPAGQAESIHPGISEHAAREAESGAVEPMAETAKD